MTPPTGGSRAAVAVLAVAALLGLAAEPVLAHGGGLGGGRDAVAAPTWLVLLTGGGVVGASFLLSSFATDRALVDALHERRWAAGSVPAVVRRLAPWAGGLALTGVILAGLLGPGDGTRNPATLLVWVGWWAGYVMTVYLVGDSWPALDPLRALAARLPSRDVAYPDRLGAWPSVAGLLAIVWVEVVSPLADDPRLLALAVGTYALLALAGAGLVGHRTWFARVDPIARVIATYGRLAPLGRDGDGRLRWRVPGAGLVGWRAEAPGEAAFVVALLWGTTFDGLVATPAWAAAARAVVGASVPAAVVYPGALLLGFGACYAVFRLAVRRVRRDARTYLPPGTLRARFAPALVPIAAGYHLAHYLGYLLAWAPALATVLASPLGPPADVAPVALPAWLGGVELAAVLAGHVVAVAVAHAVAFDCFPGRLQAIRSQYALVAAMVVYTMTSLWIVSRPYAAPPFLGP